MTKNDTGLESCELDELIQRYETLIQQYIPMAIEIANKLEKFGKIKKELQIITAEFVNRGHVPAQTKELEERISQEIAKRELISNDDPKTDKL